MTGRVPQPAHAGRLLAPKAMQERIAQRLEGAAPPSVLWIQRAIPREYKVRVGRGIACWEDDFETWFQQQFGRKSA